MRATQDRIGETLSRSVIVVSKKAHRLFTKIGAPIRAAEVAKELGL